MKQLKIFCIGAFFAFGFVGLITSKSGLVQTAGAYPSGPPAGFSGAPDESSCDACHFGSTPVGQFAILNAPANYNPGQTYQIKVRHTTADTTRMRWGFEMTTLAGQTPAGSFGNIGSDTQIINANGRSYIEHTLAGTFQGVGSSATWTFNWTAPATNVGPVGLYAAGNQANNDETPGGDQIYTASVVIQPPLAPVVAPYDFDGDHKTDLSIFRPGPGEWWYSKSSNGGNAAAQFGAGTDKITPGDFTGDGKADFAFFRPSTGFWFVLRSEDFSFYSFPFGTSTDVPAPADYDGDGKMDAAVYRPSTNTWFINNSGGGTTITTFGTAGDVPVAADYDGDGKADIAIYRPSLGQWWIARSSGTTIAYTFGTNTDRPVPGDYTGDHKADVAFWRPSTGTWFILRSEDNSFYSFPFGTSTDIPVPGDYDGDGKIDAAVYRPSNNLWFANTATAGVIIQPFGQAADIPVPNAYVR